MRHQLKGFKLGRTHSHRKATLSALSNALIEHKRITTTVTKAKALRMYVEPIINRAKEDTTANRRQVFRHLHSKEAVKELYGAIAPAIADRPGGYTRIVKLGQRPGDGTEMAVIELVDFNESKPTREGTTRRRRTRRSKSSGAATGAATKTADKAEKKADQPKADAPKEEQQLSTEKEHPIPNPNAITPQAADPNAPEKTSDVAAQSPGTPLTAPEATAAGEGSQPDDGKADGRFGSPKLNP